MVIKINRSLRMAAIVSALAFVSVAAQAATVHFKATLKASSEVPAKMSKGTGTLTATLDTTTNELKYHVVYKGLTGPATAAHFHGPAAEGSNAGPQVAVSANPISSPIDGTATLTADQVKDLTDGNWYFNIHTAANGSGEIRGQVMKK
jgi:CHRD domain